MSQVLPTLNGTVRPFRGSIRPAIVLSCLVASGGAFAQSNAATPPPAVVVAPVQDQNVGRSDQFVGRIQAIQSVNLVARVEGFLEQFHFAEGSMVEANDTLIEIEKAPYQAALAQAQGQLAAANAQVSGAQAQLKNAEVVLERQKTLVARGTVSQATEDDAQASRDVAAANVQQAQAAVQEAEAAVQTAQLNLSYTDVVAPITGQIGVVNITVGNLVNTQSGTIATINQLDPIRVAFSIPESLYVSLAGERPVRRPTSSTATSADAANVDNAAATPAGSGAASASPADDATASDTTASDTAATESTGDGTSDAATNGSAAPATDATAPQGDAAATPSAATAASTDATADQGDASTADAPAAAPADSAASAAATAPPAMTEGSDARADDLFKPELVLPNGKTYTQDGRIAFASNQIDASTGTLVVYADFPNPDSVLLPGSFVNVNVAEANERRLPVVPASAVLQDRNGRYVFVVNDQNRAEQRRIETAQQTENGFPVTSGLTAGETIIVQGLQKVQAGQEVTPTRDTASAPAGGASAGAGTSGANASGNGQ
ncbi:efflux RND transporter periplasmic adaptor subunit [Acuticoccus sp. M5D2P5]|uniref:efflux RND transporter periplasmic adaptor subunit n=1 Tax=Acuticoccus kalidii TaxID=2910977 RepID=UPI001F1F45E2|nr:efflux RND transporter periplasmic adaptor subunit [Acuticoccus kalidii]MCF3932664.1 efflux RND transporter periplasmic adaptor subunit [Acuticoccus kalidii]